MSYGRTVVSQRGNPLNSVPQTDVILLAQTLFFPVWEIPRLPGYQCLGFVSVHWLWAYDAQRSYCRILWSKLRHPGPTLFNTQNNNTPCLLSFAILTDTWMRSDAFGAFNQSQRKDTHNLSESFQTRTVRNNQMTNQTQAWEMKDLFDAERIYMASIKWGHFCFATPCLVTYCQLEIIIYGWTSFHSDATATESACVARSARAGIAQWWVSAVHDFTINFHDGLRIPRWLTWQFLNMFWRDMSWTNEALCDSWVSGGCPVLTDITDHDEKCKDLHAYWWTVFSTSTCHWWESVCSTLW